MFDVMPYHTMSAGDDLAAQKHAEGGRRPPPVMSARWLVMQGVLSPDQARRFSAAWSAIAAKARRRSGWGRP